MHTVVGDVDSGGGRLWGKWGGGIEEFSVLSSNFTINLKLL